MIRQKVPDKKNALSIIEAAEHDMRFTLTLPATEAAGPTLVRNIYESFRMLGDALLIARGIKAEDHVTPIQELIALPVKTERPLQVIDRLRTLRHNINYYGYRPTQEEVEEAISITNMCFHQLLHAVKRKVNEK
ncbi:hypothetical protein HYS47_03465 [Candidatus Woesearchaeota archaeon]|nr:hypothetical protein [Candidatus Woesearchaeota archaeon]